MSGSIFPSRLKCGRGIRKRGRQIQKHVYQKKRGLRANRKRVLGELTALEAQINALPTAEKGTVKERQLLSIKQRKLRLIKSIDKRLAFLENGQI